MPSSQHWLLATGQVPAVFLTSFFFSEVVCHCLLPGTEREWLAEGHPAGFVPKAGLELSYCAWLALGLRERDWPKVTQPAFVPKAGLELSFCAWLALGLRERDWPKVTQPAFLPKAGLELTVSRFLPVALTTRPSWLSFGSFFSQPENKITTYKRKALHQIYLSKV